LSFIRIEKGGKRTGQKFAGGAKGRLARKRTSKGHFQEEEKRAPIGAKRKKAVKVLKNVSGRGTQTNWEDRATPLSNSAAKGKIASLKQGVERVLYAYREGLPSRLQGQIKMKNIPIVGRS